MSKIVENEDGTIQIHYTEKDFTADLPEAGASAERIRLVIRRCWPYTKRERKQEV